MIIRSTRCWRWLFVLFALCGALSARAEAPGFFSDEANTELYDCTLAVIPAAKLTAKSRVILFLEWQSNANCTRVIFTQETITVDSVRNGKVTPHGQVLSRVTRGKAYELTVMRRGVSLGLLCQNAIIFRQDVPRGSGVEAGVTADRGWTVEDARVQRLEPVAFSDNFMRTADEPGNWVTFSGEWKLQSAWDQDPKGNDNRFKYTAAGYSQNPFSWGGRNPKGTALCTTGKDFWEDYTFTLAVRPALNGAVGAMVNLTDPRNGLLVRWSGANDRSAQGNLLSLYRVVDGQRTLVSQDTGGFVPDQWYQLKIVSSLGEVQVFVDGRERLTASGVLPRRGGVGLYAEGAEWAEFDDITAYGRTLKKDLITEQQMVHINQRFIDDTHGMQEWSNIRGDWYQLPAIYNHWIHRLDYYGDQWLSLIVKPNVSKIGQLWMVLNGDGVTTTSGYRAVIQFTEDKTHLTYALCRDTQVLAQKELPLLEPNVDYSFRFSRFGNRLKLEQDGKAILEAVDNKPLSGTRPAYRIDGAFTAARDVVVIGRNILDYIFHDAQVDWISEGTWMPTVRWSCSPNWTFISGWSRGDTVFWHKKRFSGDQSFEAFLGLKMEYPRARQIYDERYRNFSITICSDGRNPRTGYAGIYGAPDAQGNPNKRTVLLRNGVEVAGTDFAMPGRGQAHREWFDLALYKRGNTIEFWVEGQLRLTYKDPEPIDGGVPALWSTDNGIAIARARLHFQHPPEPRIESRIILDDPWYPEWTNVGKTLTVDFPESWSTTGKSVQLRTTTHIVPDGGVKSTIVTQGLRAAFTPAAPGDYWYELFATDGALRSPGFHLALPAFDPALGRDDSHALVLYRFNEGKGNIVRDQSKVAPALDLSVFADTTWLPGQGITVHGGSPMFTRGAEKLKALAEKKAFTIELWVSTDTIYPPIGWKGCMLAWEMTPAQRNFMVGQWSENFSATAQGDFDTNNAGCIWSGGGFRIGLRHLAVTWDGTSTSLYLNGQKVTTKAITWNPDRWDVNAPLLLGNQQDSQRPYLGTFYLAAIHDQCLTDAQLLRHYQAGPSAR
ncbi:MAG: LamG-like jellyroll fold domain-containing protein [Armatimonadota bacterium]